MGRFRRNGWWGFLGVFALAFVVYNANLRRIAAFDSVSSSLLPMALLSGDGFFLDGWSATVPAPMAYSIVTSPKTGRPVSLYPVVTPLLATPLYLPWRIARASGAAGDTAFWSWLMDKLAASFLAALSVAVLWRVFRKIAEPRDVLWLTVAYGFATSTWSISSQALWQHTGSELLLAFILLLLVKDELSPALLVVLGAASGLLTANRPVNVFFSVALAATALRRWKGRSWPFFAGASIVAGAWFAYNLSLFASPVGGYGDYRLGDGRPLWMAANGIAGSFGLLFSNRGLFVFCPFLLLFFLAPRKSLERVSGLGGLLAAFLAYLYLTARTPDWAGGYSYGPRMLADGLPILVVALAGPLGSLRHAAARLGVAAAIGFGVVLQLIGVTCFPGGDSGNESLGLFTVERSGPVRAALAGLQTPEFTGGLGPMDAPAAPLSSEARVTSTFDAPLPGRWRAREGRFVSVRFRNEGSGTLSSIGGWWGGGAFRLTAGWEGAPPGPVYTKEEPNFWLAWRLRPGEEVRRRLYVRAPNTTGAFRLCVGFLRVGLGRVLHPGFPPQCERVEVMEGAEEARRPQAVEWNGSEGPGEMTVGQEASFDVEMRNVGREDWEKDIKLACRWKTPAGEVKRLEDFHAPLTPAGGSRRYRARAKVIADVPAGLYDLEFDLIQEGVAWFGAAGLEPMTIRLRVSEPAGR